MPKNSPYGFLIGVLSFTLSFAIIWAIVWLGIVSLLGMLAAIFIRLCEKETEYTVSADQVAAIEAKRFS